MAPQSLNHPITETNIVNILIFVYKQIFLSASGGLTYKITWSNFIYNYENG